MRREMFFISHHAKERLANVEKEFSHINFN